MLPLKMVAVEEYTYLELQAKTMPYTEEDLIADFLNAVVIPEEIDRYLVVCFLWIMN